MRGGKLAYSLGIASLLLLCYSKVLSDLLRLFSCTTAIAPTMMPHNDADAIANDGPDVSNADDPCAAWVSNFFRMNECFRSYSDKSSSCSVAAPVHHYAVYDGQGFGRIIDHSVHTCMFAADLRRPCVIDLDARDRYYTWRSFINVGTYNWDWRIVQHHENILDALGKLEKPGSAEWKEPFEYDDVLPMVWREDWGTAKRHFEYWSGYNNATRDKILLSPNWGPWFVKKVSWPTTDRKTLGCSRQRLHTKIQNAMYAPTSLALELHRERRNLVIGASAYGSIHLRLSLFKRTQDQIVKSLKSCLEMYPRIEKWWLIADNNGLDMANNISENIGKIRHAYTEELFNRTMNKHSGMEMKKLFAHETMAPSIQDWMVLHESDVAIVSRGSFGSTGARGNGKVPAGECGALKMQVFAKDSQ
uniref:Uncharacterized protein n=1 Tax=Odontella aurita TaxID=265563 RepID=A0A7S4IFW3_9STRA|mmetsp:Transcript_24625/g.71985  ORF Transcript_24625/g.71985 Transcript_24625/m.71985 type:complete len:417 (+) Transcript_24625:187-1437(+)